MRAVLSLALALLFLAVLGNVVMRFEHHASPTRAAVHVLVVAKGRLLQRAQYGDGESLGSIIQVEDTNLSFDGAPAGLRVATLSPSLALEGHELFALASSADELARLDRHVARAPVGTVLALGTSDAYLPPAAAQRASFDALAARLGSSVAPFELDGAGGTPPSSWALITLRGARGWIKLAESFSLDSGIVLAFTIDPDLTRYADYRGETVLVETERRELPLHMELDAVDDSTAIGFTFTMGVGGVPKRAVFAPVPTRGKRPLSRAVWHAVPLGEAPRFRAEVGLRDGAWARSNGVVFQVLVDDEIAGELALGTDGVPLDQGWQPFEVDLAPWAHRAVVLELRVDPRGDTEDDWALWAEPTITSAVGSNER